MHFNSEYNVLDENYYLSAECPVIIKYYVCL